MAKSSDDWNVLEHGSLVQLQDNLWHVEGVVPHMALGRHMLVARMSDGRLVIHGAIALDDEGMKSVEALGDIAYVIVPNGLHRLDAPRFHKRYPDAKVLCPVGSRKKVEKVVPVDGCYDDFPADSAVCFEALDGLANVEGVMIVTGGEGKTMVFTDTLFNIAHQGGFGGFVMRMLGSSGGTKVPPVMRLLGVKDKKALAGSIARLAETPDLKRLVPGHGKIIDADAAQVLRDLATTL